MPPADDAVERALRTFASATIGEVAHELNNRLGTMRETVGLLEDLAQSGKSSAAGTARARAALDDQVGRALNVVRALGGLGGALAGSAGSFDLCTAIENLLDLNQRWARQRSLRLDRAVADELPRAAGDPALFLCLAQRALRRCAEPLRPGGSLLVRVGGAGAGIAVRLVPAGPRPEGAPPASVDDDAVDRALTLRLGGELLLEGDGTLTITLASAR